MYYINFHSLASYQNPFCIKFSFIIIIIDLSNRFIHSFQNQIHAHKNNIKERKKTNPNESLTSKKSILAVTLTISSSVIVYFASFNCHYLYIY